MPVVQARGPACCRAGATTGRARLAGVVLGAALTGLAPGLLCGADAPAKVFELRINGGTLPLAQRVMRVAKGDTLRWRVTSDAAGQIHLHAYRLAAQVAPDQVSEVVFDAFASGRFRVEWHPADVRPEARGAHPAAPLATLEVRPR